MQLKLFVNSARNLKHVNWRSGRLQPYAVVWIDSGGKRSTKVDENNGINPVWNEMFNIPLPSKSRPETAVLYVDIVHAEAKQLIGSANLPLRVILDEALSKRRASFSLILERPSGRSQGSLEIQIEINDSKDSTRKEPCRQQVRNMSQLPPVQPPVQPLVQPPVQPPLRPQYPPQQMNQCHNMPATVMPRYPANPPQNFRPALPQQPGNVMFIPSIIRPQYRPVFQQPPPLAALNRLFLHAGRNHLENMMMQSLQQMQPVGAFQGDMGMSNYTDGGFDNSGLDSGGFGDSGCDFGGFGDGGFDLGGFDGSACDFGGADFGGFGF